MIGWLAFTDQARYSCSISSTHRAVRGEVRSGQGGSRSCAALAKVRSSPSGPPMTSHVVAAQLPAREAPSAQGLGGRAGAALVQGHDARTARNGGFDTLALGGIQRLQRLGAARFRLDGL